MSPPRPPRGEVSNRGRASRKAAEKAWEQELGIAERRGAKRVRDRLLALREEHQTVIDGIEYVEWSALAAALEEEVRPLSDPTARRTPGQPPGGGAGPGPSPTSG
jgi:hypothetical protein